MEEERFFQNTNYHFTDTVFSRLSAGPRLNAGLV